MRALLDTLLVTTLFLLTTEVRAQSFKVLVLDAVSGKPQENIHVNFYCSDSRRNYFPVEEDDTDSEGIVNIPYKCKGDQPKIVINAGGAVEMRHHKEQCGGDEVVASYEQISSKGIISSPDEAGQMQCTTKISRKLKPVPGQVVIFVKKPSWWQSHF